MTVEGTPLVGQLLEFGARVRVAAHEVVLGRPIRYADPTPWHYWRRMQHRRMPSAMIAVTLGIYTAARFGLAASLTDDVVRITGRPPIDFVTFARDHRDAWVVARQED